MRYAYRLLACGLIAALGTAPAARAHEDVPGLDVNGQCVGDADSNAAVDDQRADSGGEQRARRLRATGP